MKRLILISLLCGYIGLTNAQVAVSVPVIVDLILSGDSSPPVDSSFGATRVAESERPTRAWLSVFDGEAAVPLVGSLQNEVDNCITPCVIELDQLDLSETVFINRRNIKLIGKTGNKITYTALDSFLFIETGAQNIVIENLNLDGRIAGVEIERDPEGFGIQVAGESITNVLIKSNHIHHLDGKEGAHAIIVLGEGATEQTAISNIIIEFNELNDLRTGFSESLAINGNVKNWEIISNTVTDVNNIAIDAIGGEGTSPTRAVAGRVLPGLLDAARLGFIQNNTVTNMSTVTNPAYDSEHTFAAGVYVDGGRDILISGNVINNTPWAVELGAENCVDTRNITIENNQAVNSRFGDLIMGGYAAVGFLADTGINCDPLTSIDEQEGHGQLSRITVVNNAFDSIGVLENLIELSNRVLTTIIVEDEGSVVPVNTDGNTSGDQNSIRTSF